MNHIEYWQECISTAAEECDLTLTEEQSKCLAESVAFGHEHFGMAFYSPPSSERISGIEREWKAKLKALQDEYDRYVANAEKAVKKALRQCDDSKLSIGDHGEVLRYGGRTERIQ